MNRIAGNDTGRTVWWLTTISLLSLFLFLGTAGVAEGSKANGFEAESMKISGKGKVLTGPAASNKKVLFFWSRGSGISSLSVPATRKVEITARGNACRGKFPIMTLSIGGRVAKTWAVKSKVLTGYTANLSAGSSMDGNVKVSLANASSGRKCNRSLVVDRVDFVPLRQEPSGEETPSGNPPDEETSIIAEPPVAPNPSEETPAEEPPAEETPIEEVGGEDQGIGTTCSQSLQSQINSTPSGGTLLADGCIYREQVTISKPITLKGQQGTEIRGSDVWRDWTGISSNGQTVWESGQSLPVFSVGEDVHCNTGTSRCKWPEQVFMDGSPLTQVASGPKPGQFAMSSDRRVILGESPLSKTVEVSVRRAWVLGSSGDVRIEGFTMKHAATEGRTAALMNRMSRQGKGFPNWVVQNNTLSDAHAANVSLKGASGLQLLDNDIFRGGQIGVHGAADGEIIRGNRIYANNTEDFESLGSPGLVGGGEAGGIKVTEASDTVFTDNEVFDNNGNGVHYDRWNQATNTISNNRIYGNARRGIHYEVSRGGRIFGNIVYDNGWGTPNWVNGAGIGVSNSSNVEVYDNILAWNADGIAVASLDRSTDEYDHVRDVYVHDNVIIAQDDPNDKYFSLALGWVQSWSNTMVSEDYNNRGSNNRYWNPKDENTQSRFRWGTTAFSKLDSFQQTRGEEGSSYMSVSTKDAIIDRNDLPSRSRIG